MNVRQMAEMTKTTEVIARAISFDDRLQNAWKINVEFNSRLKMSYGRGGPSHYGIKLHPLLKQHPIQLRNTFLHELAHCMEYLLYRKCGHGAQFWESMIRLGEKPWIKDNHEFSLREHYRQEAADAETMLSSIGL